MLEQDILKRIEILEHQERRMRNVIEKKSILDEDFDLFMNRMWGLATPVWDELEMLRKCIKTS